MPSEALGRMSIAEIGLAHLLTCRANDVQPVAAGGQRGAKQRRRNCDAERL